MSLRDEILARSDLADAVAARNIDVIAQAMSVSKTKLQQKFVGVGTIMSTLGAVEGSTVLANIKAQVSSNPVIEFGWMLIDRGALDIGDAEVQKQIDIMAAAGLMTMNDAAKIKALGVVADFVTPAQVADALYNADGSLK